MQGYYKLEYKNFSTLNACLHIDLNFHQECTRFNNELLVTLYNGYQLTLQ